MSWLSYLPPLVFNVFELHYDVSSYAPALSLFHPGCAIAMYPFLVPPLVSRIENNSTVTIDRYSLFTAAASLNDLAASHNNSRPYPNM